VLPRQGDQLRGQQGAVVVVENAVEHEDALLVQLAPHAFVEQRDLAFFAHGPTVRWRAHQGEPYPPAADPLRAAPGSAGAGDRPLSVAEGESVAEDGGYLGVVDRL